MLGPDFHKDNTQMVAANLNLDPIQNNCIYGYVLPDRCRYMRHKGCPCGAYPPIPCQATFKEYCQFPKCDCDRPY